MKISKKILMTVLLGTSFQAYAMDGDLNVDDVDEKDQLAIALAMSRNDTGLFGEDDQLAIAIALSKDDADAIHAEKASQIRIAYDDMKSTLEFQVTEEMMNTDTLYDANDNFNEEGFKEALLDKASETLHSFFPHIPSREIKNLLTDNNEEREGKAAPKEVKQEKLEEPEENFEFTGNDYFIFGEASKKVEDNNVKKTLEKIQKEELYPGDAAVAYRAWQKQLEYNTGNDYEDFAKVFNENSKLTDEQRKQRIFHTLRLMHKNNEILDEFSEEKFNALYAEMMGE